ncbi:4-aminobutyrate aminotransferase-like enzyme [Novosphingobium hassiacum]|uniref:4-aminobutyrate aminotransferase-like enzyme n=1 Tax=Novosphingobium hassiacum TaxID=173676 RepID=A0A7W6EV51_9SPHN|nr:aspartate aminotransferase family protein [Novosphingobium hassiacum]MBB3859595.1 4-aminobutyrate aminotransferase-like enzyme [Novosphingobium hassiacum]
MNPETTELLARRERVLSPSYRLFYEQPIHAVRAQGCWIEDADGQRYLDAYNNVPVAGHCHPRILAAMAQQGGVLNTHTRYLTELPVLLAERLLATLPEPLGKVVLTNSGSEANDLAIRISRLMTGQRGVIVTDCAYHGTSDLLQGMSPVTGLPLGPDVYAIQMPLVPVGPEQFAALVSGAIERMEADGVMPAALIVDTIFGSDGVIADPAGFLAGGVQAIRKAGGLFIADEVQPGFGRTGAGMWGFTRHGVVPDMVTTGKPMGNGQPVAALIMRDTLATEFSKIQRYFNTFGGSSVSCAAALATLDVIDDEGLIDNAARMGKRLMAGLSPLIAASPLLTDLRGAGLFIGVQTVSGEIAAAIVNALRRGGVLIGAAGRGNAALKIRPPLAISESETGQLLEAFARAVNEVQRSNK